MHEIHLARYRYRMRERWAIGMHIWRRSVQNEYSQVSEWEATMNGSTTSHQGISSLVQTSVVARAAAMAWFLVSAGAAPPPPQWACCDRADMCAITTELGCYDLCGVFSEGKTCAEVNCNEDRGPCCDRVNLTCEDDVLRSDCLGANQAWFNSPDGCAGVRCACPDDASDPAVQGACCDRGNSCDVTLQPCAMAPPGQM